MKKALLFGGAAALYATRRRHGRRSRDTKLPAMRAQTVKGPWGTKTMQVSKIKESDLVFDYYQIGFVRYRNETWQVNRKVPRSDAIFPAAENEGIPWETSFDKSTEQRWAERFGEVYVKPTPQKKESILPAHLRPEFDRFVLSILGRPMFIPHKQRDFSRIHWDPNATKDVWNPPTAGDIAKWIFLMSDPGGGRYYSSELGKVVTDPGWQVSPELYAVLDQFNAQVWLDNARLRSQWTTQVRSALKRLQKQGKVFMMTGYRKGKTINEWALKEYEV